MDAEEHLQAGRLEGAAACLQDSVRKDPAEPKHRIFLFQLFCIMGSWERALTQLQVLAELNADTMLLAQIFRPVINCEILRGEIFSGKRTPIIFGEPLEWVGWLVQACSLVAQGEFKAAQELRERAFEAAPATPGKSGETSFAWIADADTRLGPVLEAMLDGHYYWVPFCRIKEIQVEPPADLRNLVWLPVQFTWTNGGATSGFIPTRYPGTESATDGGLRLARKTDWIEKPGGTFLGLGQRVLATDEAELPLLEIRKIELNGG